MQGKDPQDYIRELFGDVIFSYTDQQALEDGVLYDVAPLSRHGVNRVTNSVYAFLGGFDRPDDLAAQYRDLEEVAKSAFERSADKELVEFRYKDQRFWMMDNETGARTIMFPEDY